MRRSLSLACLSVVVALGVDGCSFLSLTGTPLPCASDDACPKGDVCFGGYCLSEDAVVSEGEGDLVVGEGEGDLVVGEGEGDLVVGEGEGEGDLVVGEGEGDLVVGEGEGDVGEGEGEGGEGEGDFEVGCADGSDEGFNDVAGLRACAGPWETPGLQKSRDVAGSAASLCAPGWHICESFFEVETELGAQECRPGVPGTFLTRQSTTGAITCGAGGNDLVGCSDSGTRPFACGPLTATLLCSGNNGFVCTGGNSIDEALHVAHSGDIGGVLCCVDDDNADVDGCVAETSFTIGAAADAAVTPVSPEISAGRELFLAAGVGVTSLVRFDNDAFFDPALRGVELVLQEDTTQGPSSRPARFRLGRFTDAWTEFRDDCGSGSAGGSLCDGVADGVSFNGPNPSTNGAQAPWPGDEFPGAIASFGTFTFDEGAVFAAPLSAEAVRSATHVDGLDTGRFTFIVDNASGSTFYGSRESDHGPTLVVHRCIDR